MLRPVRSFVLLSLLAVLSLMAWSARGETGAPGAALDLRSARQLAEPEAVAAYGALTYRGAEPYDDLTGSVSAWAIEYFSTRWNTSVSALVSVGGGLQAPVVKLWTGRPLHLNPDRLAAAALAVHDRTGAKVTLPEKYFWLGERALWAQYPEENPATGGAIFCNLIDRRVAASPAEILAPPAKPGARPAASSPLFGGSVNYPSDDGITWLRGQSYTIRWDDFNGSKVRIELYKGLKLVDSRKTDNDGQTNWDVSKDADLGSDYRIKISAADNPFQFDWSDHAFSIASAGRKAIYPSDSGITWKRGGTYSVRWSGFAGSKVQLDLFLGPLRVQSRTTDNDGQTDWTVDGTLASSDQYKIRISETDDPSHLDWSDNTFKISGSSAKVIYPSASGITWKRGKKYTVQWSGFSGDSVRIELWNGNTLKAWKTTDNDGSDTWSVAKDISKSSDYKIRISSVSSPSLYDWSDKSFKISD